MVGAGAESRLKRRGTAGSVTSRWVGVGGDGESPRLETVGHIGEGWAGEAWQVARVRPGAHWVVALARFGGARLGGSHWGGSGSPDRDSRNDKSRFGQGRLVALARVGWVGLALTGRFGEDRAGRARSGLSH